MALVVKTAIVTLQSKSRYKNTIYKLSIQPFQTGTSCNAPPLPDLAYDLSLKIDPSYQYSPWGDLRVPLFGEVSFTCVANGRFQNDSTMNSFSVECVNLTTGAYQDFSWPQCIRSEA